MAPLIGGAQEQISAEVRIPIGAKETVPGRRGRALRSGPRHPGGAQVLAADRNCRRNRLRSPLSVAMIRHTL